MASEEPAGGEKTDGAQPVHHRLPPATGGRAAHAARDVDFPLALRGYDRAAVDRYVEEVNQAIAELEISSSPQSAIRHALEQVSEETSGLLQRAHETADEITERSRAQADDRLQHAERRGARGAAREAAERRAESELRAEGQARVDALTRNAEAIAEERRRLIGEVLEIAERLGDLAREEAQRFLDREEAAAEEPPTEKIELSAGRQLTRDLVRDVRRAPRAVTSISWTFGSLRIQVSWRRAYWRLFVFIASMSPASSSSKPSALRAVADAPASCAAFASSSAPAPTITSTRRSICSYSAARSIVRPTSRVGWRVSSVHSCDSTCGSSSSERAHLEQLEQPDHAAAIGRRRPSRPPAALAAPGARACLGADAVRLLLEPLAQVRAAAAASGRAPTAPRAGRGRCRPRRSGVRPAPRASSISLWASGMNSPTENVRLIGTKPIRRCSRCSCSASLAAPVRIGMPS